MATGYTRNDTANNIANGNTINASDLDGEFDAIQSAMDATTGHNHDGTVGGGAPIVGIGPVQDVVITTSALRPKTDNTVDLGTSSLEFKDLYLDGTAQVDTLQVDESATITANLTVSGNATISTNLTVNGNTVLGDAITDTINVIADFISDLVPDVDNTYDLGLSTNEWRNLYIDGTAQVDTLQVDESATITANLTVNGDTTLGNAAGDTVTVTARVASNLVPSTDGAYDLGSSDKEWKDLYITGTAQVDSLQVDASATITNNLTVNGNTTLGDTTADTVTFTARAASNFLPSVDGTYDLGSSANEWQDLYIDGVARIDSLIADTVDINAGTAILSSAKVITSNGGNLTIQRDDISVEAGDTLGGVDFQAPNESSGGDAVLVAASIKAVADATFSSTVNKTSLLFQTALDGPVDTRMEITGEGHVLPGGATNDLGSTSREWRDLWITGTANIDSLVADTADINGGTIDGATIATSDITVGAGKTFNVSAGTLTIANDQISGDKVEGGTINAITINTLDSTTVNATTVDTTNIEVTNLKAKDGTAAGSIANSTGVVTLASSVLTTTDINGGTIDATTIGATTAAAGTFTSVTAPSVTITGGTINGTSIGATTASTIAGTTGTFSGAVTASNVVVSNGFVDTGATAGGTTVFLQGFRNDAGQSGGAVRIRSAGDGAGNAVQMIFDTNSSEAMRIGDGTTGAAASYLGLNGISTPTAPLHVNGNARLEGANISLIFSETDTNNTDARIRLQGGNLLFETLNDNDTLNRLNLTLESGGSLILAGSTAQKATGTTWSNPSDQRLKSNITDYPKGIPELMQVRVCEWEYNGKGGTVEGMRGIGVIADEVMVVLPNTVETYDAKLNDTDEETTAIKKFDATEITWLLVKAVQEQQAIINSLEARLSALEAQ